jgi:hypothetical protein
MVGGLPGWVPHEEPETSARRALHALHAGRTPTSAGGVPFHDAVGWYRSDAVGRPRPETFEYSRDHRLALPDGTLSSILSDPQVQAAALAAPGRT